MLIPKKGLHSTASLGVAHDSVVQSNSGLVRGQAKEWTALRGKWYAPKRPEVFRVFPSKGQAEFCREIMGSHY